MVQGKAQVKNVENWAKNVAKIKRNLGEAYIRYATKK